MSEDSASSRGIGSGLGHRAQVDLFNVQNAGSSREVQSNSKSRGRPKWMEC